MEFSFFGISVAQRQTGFCHLVPGVPGLPAVRGRTCPLNRTMLVPVPEHVLEVVGDIVKTDS